MLTKTRMVALMALILTSGNTVLATDEVDFDSTLYFNNYPPAGFQISGGPIVGTSLGGLLGSGSVVIGGSFLGGGPFSVGSETTSGGVTEAPLTGATRIQISDFTFAGTLDGALSLTEIQQTPGVSGYNYLVVGTISGLSLAGSDPGLLTLEGQGTLSLTLTIVNSSMDLSTLVADANAGNLQSIGGVAAINAAMVPDDAITLALLGGTGTALGFLRRKSRV